MMTRLLPALTLAAGLLGMLAAAGGGRPWWIGYLALSLVMAGAFGIEESTPCEP